MAKKHTHKQSIESVMSAITAITNGESEENCNKAAKAAIETVKNSNSMVLAELIDEGIELEETLTAAATRIDGDIPAQIEGEIEAVDDIPF